MSETNFTPAPWHVAESAHGSVWAGSDTQVASCDWEVECPYCANRDPDYRAGRHDFNPREVRYANARLIAAAPELLEALAEIVRLWDSPKEKAALSYVQLEKAKAALAKVSVPRPTTEKAGA